MINKFKAWDKVNKEIVDIDGEYLYIADGEIYEIYSKNYNYDCYMEKNNVSDRYIPLQSTGIFDKNDKEIYEGHIVRGLVDTEFNQYLKFIVEWDTNHAAWVINPIHETYLSTSITEFELEIIGWKF